MDTTTPLSRFLNHPAILALIHVLTPLFASLLTAYFVWVNGELLTSSAAIFIGALGILELLNVITGSLALFRKNFRTQEQWTAIILNSLAVVLILSLTLYTDTRMATMLPVWIDLDAPVFFLIFCAHLTLLQCAIGAICARPFRYFNSYSADFVSTFICGLGLVGAGLLIASLSFATGVTGHFLGWGIILIGFLLISLLLHMIGLLTILHSGMAQRYKYYSFCLRLLCVGFLPMVALILNATIPLPFDLQTPWIYALTLLFSLSVLLPSTRLTTWFRWMLLPFTLYFFIIFLPVLPFVVIAILFFGLGFLWFIPLFAFWQHLQSLRDVKLPRALILLALLVIPVGFILITERDRIITRALIEHISTPDYTSGHDTLPMPEERARAAAHTIYHYERGDRMPFLSRWRDFRLFDSLHPREETLNALIARFGAPQSARLYRTSRPSLGAFTPLRSRKAPTVTLTPKDDRRLTVQITLPADPNREFRSAFRLAYGVWVTGLRLQLPDGTWKEATFRDRRAATWIYESIVRQQRDPALLTLDSPTRGTLRVFPLDIERHLEIDLLLPQPNWAPTPFELQTSENTKTFDEALPLNVPLADTRTPATVCFVEGGTSDIPEDCDLYVLCGHEIRVSTTRPTPGAHLEDYDRARAIRFAQGYAYAHNLRIADVTSILHAETRSAPINFTVAIEPPRPALPMLAPDDPWQLGAQMWQLAEAMHHNQTLDHRKEIRELAERCGVLTPTNAYIVVETLRQERELAATDLGVKHAGLAFDVTQTNDNAIHQDTPGAFILTVLFLLLLALLRKFLRILHP